MHQPETPGLVSAALGAAMLGVSLVSPSTIDTCREAIKTMKTKYPNRTIVLYTVMSLVFMAHYNYIRIANYNNPNVVRVLNTVYTFFMTWMYTNMPLNILTLRHMPAVVGQAGSLTYNQTEFSQGACIVMGLMLHLYPVLFPVMHRVESKLMNYLYPQPGPSHLIDHLERSLSRKSVPTSNRRTTTMR